MRPGSDVQQPIATEPLRRELSWRPRTIRVEGHDMPSWLPVGVAAFIGRESECAKLLELVAGARVVTLTGTGGCGKTRLAMEVAGAAASRFSDGRHRIAAAM